MNRGRKFISVYLLGALTLHLPFISAAAPEVFARNLRFGDSGPDVYLLQKTLNQDADTRLAASGPGSLGNETEYFGAATKAGVERFQRKYAQDTLIPAGLDAPTGFVGPLTRAKLYALAASAKPAPMQNGSSQKKSAPKSLKTATSTPAGTSTNPNLVNIDFYLEKVAELERVNGVNEETINEHAKSIREYAASTSTNFRTQFETDLRSNLTNPPSSGVPWGVFSMFEKLLEPILGLVMKPAQAVTGVPFGGPIVYVYPCSCPPGIFSLGVGPPSTTPILNYVVGTQAFLSYNLPAARFFLGLYTPGVQSCWQYAVVACFPIPAAGQIQPMVGSSPL